MELCSFLIVDSWTHAFWYLEKLYPILDAYSKDIQPSGEPYLNLSNFYIPDTGTMSLKGHSCFLSRQTLHDVPENVKICGVHDPEAAITLLQLCNEFTGQNNTA